MKLILASSSPRRRQLLDQMGIREFEVVSPDIDEVVDEKLPPSRIVEDLSIQKAAAVAETAPAGSIIIAADTVVCLEDAVLGKPADKLEAFRMLTALSGSRHQVYSGVTVRRDGEIRTQSEVTTVTFRELTEGEISDYIATGEPMDKAGAYGIQGYGALLIERVEGDYFNVMGLPVCRLGRMLADFGVHPMKLAAKG